MTQHKGYDKFEMNGSFLIPGFSIYLLEIIKGKKRFFYIGMTGDPFYPSARAAFHRLSGHLEKTKTSTQNQLWNALRDKAGIQNPIDFAKLCIKMHHFPIKGFTKWTGENMHHESIKESVMTKEYLDYKKIQGEVLTLEKSLINAFASPQLLNLTKGKKTADDFGKNKSIYNDIKNIIEN